MPDQPGRRRLYIEHFDWADHWYSVEIWVKTPSSATFQKFAGCVKSFAPIAQVRRVFDAIRGSRGPADAIRRFQQTR